MMSENGKDPFPDQPLSEEEAALVAVETDEGGHDLAEPLRALAMEEPADLAFTDAVMARVENRPHGLVARLVARLRQPTSRRQTVLTAVPVAAVVGLVTFFVVKDAVSLADSHARAVSDTAGDMFPVEFELRAPNATSVTLSGDFNKWQQSISLSDADGDGVWSVKLTLPRGQYAYQFVVDGKQRIADPKAEVRDTGLRGPQAILRL
jgi:hypothetical protein